MWSVGCILAEMYFGKSIFPGNSTINQVERIIELLGRPTQEDIESLDSYAAKDCFSQISIQKKKSFTSTFSNMDAEGLDLMRNLLMFNPSKRLTAQEALEHPYLKDFHDPEEEI